MFGVVCIFAIAGCGSKEWMIHPAATNVSKIPSASGVDLSDMKKVAILPFADYSRLQPGENNPSTGINERVLEEVTDYFVAHGLEVAVEEDVVAMLQEAKILVVGTNALNRGTVDWEYKTRYHLPKMQENMATMMADDSTWGAGEGKAGGESGSSPQGALGGISKEFLGKMSDSLGVDKVVRGRIIDYGITSNKSLNPANGILAVMLGGLGEGLGVYTRKDAYEQGLPPDTFLPQSTRGSSLAMDIPPRGRHSNVQIRLYLQDVKTGKVLWSNRAYVRYSPANNLDFAGNHAQRMLDKATTEAVKGLMGDLFKEGGEAKEGSSVVKP